MQHRGVETVIGKRLALDIALYRPEIDGTDPRQGAMQHGAIEVEADVAVLGRQKRQVEAGADAGQQDAAGFAGQGGQAALTRRLRGAGDGRVVERRDQRVAVLEAQCRTRGMASVNSGISASKCVPSSATIW